MSENNSEPRDEAYFVMEGFKRLVNLMRGEILLRGILLSLLGVLIMLAPVGIMAAVTIIIGILILADGVGMLVAALKGQGAVKQLSLAGAIVFILLGLFTCLNPVKMDVFWIVIVGFWQLFSGIQCLCFAKKAPGTSLFTGIISTLIGLVLVSSPIVGLATLSWLIGLLILVTGITSIVIAVKLKNAVNGGK